MIRSDVSTARHRPAATAAAVSPADPPEGFVRLDGRDVYGIPDCDRRLRPFLLTVASDSDLWMYLSSTGGLTAGRADEDGAIFPYETDDKLHLCHGVTGPLTLLRVRTDPAGRATLWEPFAAGAPAPGIRRNLYKTTPGDRVTFEEVNENLGLTFRYHWSPTEAFGFVRTCTLVNNADTVADIDVLDGLLNLLPADVDLGLQRGTSCLVNAYTRCEVDRQTGLAIVSLTSRISDRAEPAEALRATVAWSHGLPGAKVLLSTDQLAAFRRSEPVQPESNLRGRRGAYLVVGTLAVPPGSERHWRLAVDTRRDHVQVANLRASLLAPDTLPAKITAASQSTRDGLTRLVASADGLQAVAERSVAAHHFANVLFNNMRGGVFAHGHDVPCADLKDFVRRRNAPVFAAHAAFFDALPDRLPVRRLLDLAAQSGSPDLARICLEYLPITFGRRHGDPSRPWNRFAIRVRNPDGSQALSYQGNWRDIFQNWEAMCLSFPDFLESVIAKFVNASTPDGFNPYRVTRDGIDWEAPDPENPWSNIGYWGDHQIIYLLKLLEASRRYHPDRLAHLLDARFFSYANVPYRLKSYPELLKDRWNTITFDFDLHRTIERRAREIGSDAKLLADAAGHVHHVTLMEKLLVPALSKLSNLVLGGGIWMNTQRPEWNDANNALVGSGISLVTQCYLRRYLAFCADLLQDTPTPSIDVSAEVADWFDDLCKTYERHRDTPDAGNVPDRLRKRFLDDTGAAFDRYRQRVYRDGLTGGRRSLPRRAVVDFFRLAVRYLDDGIRANRRPDGLFHAYNLIDLSADGIELSIGRLPEMLEGQVAVLSSGTLTPAECADLTEALFRSRIYRPDQDSFMLYPERELPGFLEKNLVPADDVAASPLLSGLLDAGDTSVIARDALGQCHFNARFYSARELAAALDRLAAEPSWRDLISDGRALVLALYERVFRHHGFTGRSGTMYGYEGNGCIYWHMVSKLLLAVQECHARASREHAPDPVVRSLAAAYYRVRQGLGFNKSAADYGAFPCDPYSHTPKHAGAQQPGMTGQVKEEILTRLGELGVAVEDGRLEFRPTLLRRREFLTAPQDWTFHDPAGQPRQIRLLPGQLAFTLCQTPVIYRLSDSLALVRVVRKGESAVTLEAPDLDAATAADVFGRTGRVDRLEVTIPMSVVELP